ncbi:MAG: nucleoside deaminase [Oscillospiraceae bacterium]|nr:nucleoside deaminase [Oscillospiraceae bacterium]
MFDTNFQEEMIRLVMEETEIAIKEGNEPFGAILVDEQGNIVEKAHNTVNTNMDPTAHAEMTIIRNTCRKLNSLVLSEYTLFCNAEPCSMCMSAIIKTKIKTVYYGTDMEKQSVRAAEINNKVKVPVALCGGILQEECANQVLFAKNQKVEIMLIK